MGNFSSVQLRRSVRAVTGKKTWIFSYSGDCTRNMHCVVVSIIPRLHDRANVEQTSSRPDGTPLPGSNVGLDLAHSWSHRFQLQPVRRPN